MDAIIRALLLSDIDQNKEEKININNIDRYYKYINTQFTEDEWNEFIILCRNDSEENLYRRSKDYC